MPLLCWPVWSSPHGSLSPHCCAPYCLLPFSQVLPVLKGRVWMNRIHSVLTQDEAHAFDRAVFSWGKTTAPSPPPWEVDGEHSSQQPGSWGRLQPPFPLSVV